VIYYSERSEKNFVRIIITGSEIVHRFFPGKPGSALQDSERRYGSSGSIHDRVQTVNFHEIAPLIPAYYKAYIIGEITSAETYGPAGVKKKPDAGQALKNTMGVLP